jgi:hypothetical protein
MCNISSDTFINSHSHHSVNVSPSQEQNSTLCDPASWKDFDMDSNQAYTTSEEAKHDEAVDCIEMDSNRAYIAHSETKLILKVNKELVKRNWMQTRRMAQILFQLTLIIWLTAQTLFQWTLLWLMALTGIPHK